MISINKNLPFRRDRMGQTGSFVIIPGKKKRQKNGSICDHPWKKEKTRKCDHLSSFALKKQKQEKAIICDHSEEKEKNKKNASICDHSGEKEKTEKREHL